MARQNNGGWDFIEKGEIYQYKEDSFIAMVKILEDNSTEQQYSFKLQVEESNEEPPTENGIFEVEGNKKMDGIYNGMPQFYELPEYRCHYSWVRNNKSIYSPKRDPKITGVRLTKLKESDNPTHPNNIKEGAVKEGYYYRNPEIGQSFYIGNFITTEVVEILSENTFKTLNSIYKWEILEPES